MQELYQYHYIEKTLSITDLISLFYYKSPRNFSFDGETHDFWEFIYIDKGQMLITAGEQQYVLKAGELAFHCPGEFHAVHACGQTAANFIVCAFTCESSIMQAFRHRILTLNGPPREALQAAVQEAGGHMLPVEGCGRRPLYLPDALPGGPQLVLGYLEQMLLLLYRQSHAVRIRQRAETYAQMSNRHQLVERIRHHLEEHVHESLSLGQIARAAGCSVSLMKKKFKVETGQSLIDWFIDLKMGEARRMIEEGDLNFTQIAASLGYDNPHYFSRLFRQRNDMTMTEYGRSLIGVTRAGKSSGR
ncbi:MAG: AraC family transcriptional regulator [Ruminococcaceae bacterium]|nr:AraC family transcriptional regulator [Oscillospiraceae bacterium]